MFEVIIQWCVDFRRNADRLLRGPWSGTAPYATRMAPWIVGGRPMVPDWFFAPGEPQVKLLFGAFGSASQDLPPHYRPREWKDQKKKRKEKKNLDTNRTIWCQTMLMDNVTDKSYLEPVPNIEVRSGTSIEVGTSLRANLTTTLVTI